ncbi:chemotaxis protein CheW [Desulfosporosinus lacus]|uniref:Purine-binding chemotaxis protein CheW n=1 Tax=Desulfosporosinus lacus DSM 15449 TaxID=1121420 RepID=A0A1M6FR57_9FIRM|nr:chemotaxis protein CheW [Desulfosporosinus lacus]SHJ00176.1 purine-binding chemotaxis protein CheW [Desulfosporosinus lacus DSM 15449]
MSIQLVIFELDNKEYGIDVKAVNGILRARKFKISTLPGTDKSIEGMINLRGNVNYIFNLRNKFELIEKEISDESKFIMLNASDSTIGCIVDEVTDIVKLNDEQVQSTPNFICAGDNNYIKGIGKFDDRMIIILDPEKIFSSEFATLQNAFIKQEN